MPGMMHHNCRLKCCLRGSRVDDKKYLKEELRQEFLAGITTQGGDHTDDVPDADTHASLSADGSLMWTF